AVLAVFVAWSALDFVLHGVILSSIYKETAHFWRPEAEMKIVLMYVVSLLMAVFFTMLYAALVQPKRLLSGFRYGMLTGLMMGVSMGLGSYCVMPIPASLAWGWFLGTWVEMIVAGVIVGLIIDKTLECPFSKTDEGKSCSTC
ncbi:MAG: hypothetical protein V1746_05265, partial [bacterium]